MRLITRRTRPASVRMGVFVAAGGGLVMLEVRAPPVHLHVLTVQHVADTVTGERHDAAFHAGVCQHSPHVTRPRSVVHGFPDGGSHAGPAHGPITCKCMSSRPASMVAAAWLVAYAVTAGMISATCWRVSPASSMASFTSSWLVTACGPSR